MGALTITAGRSAGRLGRPDAGVVANDVAEGFLSFDCLTSLAPFTLIATVAPFATVFAVADVKGSPYAAVFGLVAGPTAN